MQPGLTLRPIQEGDRTFLLQVYASTRAEELARVPWTEQQKADFVRFQFEAQHAHYQAHYPNAQFSVILLSEEAAGRLYVHRGSRDLRLVDIALLPTYRGMGVGSTLLARLMEEARAADKTLSIHVERQNRALRLYQRLGFTPIGETGIYLLMEWRPAQVKIA